MPTTPPHVEHHFTAGLVVRDSVIGLADGLTVPFALAAGLTGSIVFQAFLNMAVVSKVVPFTGIPLPFISYGGSSMISLAWGMGMLLALTRERPRAAQMEPRAAFAPLRSPA